MRFKGLDLNLLVAFDALMATRSVSRAAERMNLSQPAMSAALARLRDYFGDDLLVLQGKRMHPTAFADDLMPQVRQGLQNLEVMLAKSPNFHPETSQRTFRMVASDYVQSSIIAPLTRQLAQEAPDIAIECQLPHLTTAKHLDEGQIDLMITPEYVLSGSHPAYELYREPQVVIGALDNRVLAKGFITEAEFEAAGHVAVVLGEQRITSYADRQLEIMGRRRRIEVTTSLFSAVPWYIEGTGRLALLHGRLAKDLERRFAICTVPVPFDFPAMRQMLCYHAGREEDAGLTWLRRQIEAIARPVD
ncbi:MAG: LysR family transcriptional regulator [Erythrobacter sp.]|nr:LysR family transcriptional regulator [Erythrobacter sp.]